MRNGETLAGFEGKPYVVIEPRALADLDNLKTKYQVRSKFRVQTKVRSVFDDAVAGAIEAFAAEGAIRPIRFDESSVLVQVYPTEKKVAVVFQRMIAGKEYFFTRSYDLPPPVLDGLLGARVSSGQLH